jgi:hypothetical protein
MKKCSKCLLAKEVSEFGAWKRAADGLKAHCKQCHNEAAKVHYRANTKEILAQHKRYLADDEKKARHNAAKEKYKRSIYLRLRAYLLEHPCVDCGETDPVVLEFDHVRGKKVSNIGTLAASACWQKIQTEIAKCEVRCANCHRRKTAKELGQLSWMELPAEVLLVSNQVVEVDA